MPVVSLPGSPLSEGGLLTATAVQTSAYTAAAGQFVPVSTASGAVTVTLPAAPPDATLIGVKMVAQASTNAVTVAASGADVFNVAGGPTSATLSLLYQGVVLQYSQASAVWYVLVDSLALGHLSPLGATTVTGLLTLNGGTDTAGSAPVIAAPAFANGTAAQLSDLTRDYMVYLTVTTSGTATSVTIGHTSAASDVTIMGSAAATAGQVISFRLPAGWYAKWAGTTTAIADQSAVGC
jgi:hypothetical protein